MARNNYINNSFIAGESSPTFVGRTDAIQYNQSCSELKNMMVMPQGGATRRPGFRFRHNLVGGNITTPNEAITCDGGVIFPFTASNGRSFQIIATTDAPDKVGGVSWRVIEVDSQSNDFQYKYGYFSDVLQYKRPFPVVPFTQYFWENYYTFTQEQLNEIQFAQAGNIMWFVHPDFMPFRILYQENPTSIYGSFYIETVGFPLDIDAPNDWRAIPFGAPISNRDASTYDGIELQYLGPSAVPAYRLTPSLNTNPLIPELRILGDLEIGNIIKLSDGTTTDIFVVGAISNTGPIPEVDGFFFDGTTLTPGTVFGLSDNSDSSIELPLWYKGNYPRVVGFYDARVFFGGTKDLPDTLTFSQVNDVEELDVLGRRQDAGYTDPVVATDPFEVVLKSDVVNEIQWVSAGKNITVGTGSDEFIVEGPDKTQSIGPLNYASRSESVYGSKHAKSARVENTTIFIQRHGESLREIVYNFQEDSYKGFDLNSVGSHIATRSIGDLEEKGMVPDYSGGMDRIVMQYLPYPVIWAIDSNGRLICCTRDRAQETIAWVHHELGQGQEDSLDKVLSISSIRRPKPQVVSGVTLGKQEDTVFALVKRNIGVPDGNGGITYEERLYVEQLGSFWDGSKIERGWSLDERGIRAPIYMDCAVLADSNTYTNGVITGLPHGEGAVVSVVCNGFWFGNYTVVNGEIDISNRLTSPAEEFEAIIGYNYLGRICPVTPEVPAQLGTSMNLPRRVDQVMIHFYRTLGARFGKKSTSGEENTPFYPLEELLFGVGNTNTPPNLFSGVKKVNMPPGNERRPEVLIESHLPFPFTVTHLTTKLSVHE